MLRPPRAGAESSPGTMAIPQPVKEFIRLAPVRPALPAGVRAGVVAVVPLLMASLLPAPMISWLSLGGFQAVLQDKGGAYQDRAWAMARVTLLGGASCFIGTLAGMAPLATLPLAFVLVFACGLGQAIGPGVASTGVAVAVTFFVASGMPSADPLVALANTGARMTGGLLAMLLTLVFWPVRVYRPARLAIAHCYDTLGALATSLAAGDQGSPAQHSERASIRRALEDARRVLTGTRRGRQTESERGARLVMLLENAEQLLGTCIALEGALATAPPEDKAWITGALGVMAASTREIALRLRTEGPVPGEVPRLTRPLGTGVTQVMLGRLWRDLDAASEAAEGLALGRPLPRKDRVPPVERPAPVSRRFAEKLRVLIDPHSVVLRHALRLALATTLAAAATTVMEVDHGYWVTVTVVVILQPWTSSTILKGLQRIAGTAIGAMIAVTATTWVDDPLAFAAIVFLFCSASVALLPVNYVVFSVLLTPAFVLLAELGSGNFSLGWVRVIDTVLGGGLALVAARVLWPRWERHRFPEELAATLRRSAAWMRAQGSGGSGTAEAERARRQVGIAMNNSEASLQRLLSERWTRGEDLEPLIAVLLYMRRLHATALATFSQETLPRELRLHIAEHLSGFLEELAGYVEREEPPPPSDDVARLEALARNFSGWGIGTLTRQLSILHDAAVRAFAGGALK